MHPGQFCRTPKLRVIISSAAKVLPRESRVVGQMTALTPLKESLIVLHGKDVLLVCRVVCVVSLDLP